MDQRATENPGQATVGAFTLCEGKLPDNGSQIQIIDGTHDLSALDFGTAFEARDTLPTTSLAEILGAFSYALDLTEGQPMGHSLRAAWIATRMSDALNLGDAERRTVYYATMLKDLGCSSNAARIAEIYLTDDRSFKHDFKLIGAGLGPTLKFVFSQTGAGHPLPRRARAIANILKNGPQISRELIAARCHRGAEIARLLRFSEEVAQAILALDEHWDGSGKPIGLSGDEIPLAARLALLAQIADVFFTNAGPRSARDEIRRLRGVWLDPALCDLFDQIAAHPAFWHDLAMEGLERELVRVEPQKDLVQVDEDYLDDIAAAFGQVIDAKSPYTAGHSERVADYADLVAGRIGLPAEQRRALRRAAALHDVGKLSVSCAVLEKPGKLDENEWRIVQGHARQTTEILSRIKPLRAMAMISGSHHERLDGKGYPHGLDATMLAPETRIITVCDFFDALISDRPYRAGMPVEKALSIMSEEVGMAIDPQCFDALRDSVALSKAA